MCYRNSGQCARWIDLNDNRHAEFIHLSNFITRRTDLVHMVEIFEIDCGMSWKLRKRSWIRNGEEVKLYLLKTSEMIYMPSIAGRKHENVIGPRHFSLRERRQQLIRNWEATQRLDANDYAYNRNTGCQKWVYDLLHSILEWTKAVSMWLIWASTECERF